MIYNIFEYGAIGDSIADDTDSLQQAIDKCSFEGGGTVLVDNGTFKVGTIYFKDNVTIEVGIRGKIVAQTQRNFYKDDTHHQMYTRETHMDKCLLEWSNISVVLTCCGLLDGWPCVLIRTCCCAVLRCGLKTVINLQRPGEHASCGNSLEQESGFTYRPETFMEAGSEFPYPSSTTRPFKSVTTQMATMFFFPSFAFLFVCLFFIVNSSRGEHKKRSWTER
ncbi:MAG: hypothetical protein ATN31_09600 [Candidatus Epulonipiscioides saccharophilum]|nr:MAG: hypothetical protein ATN31_09600 [Epulopiscium sp. AS2M-Bin001]